MNIRTIKITRKNALSVYTSVMTACDHITSLTAKIKPPEMPATWQIRSRVAAVSFSEKGLTTSRKLAALREIRRATSPLVIAPHRAEKRFTRQAILPMGILFVSQVSMVHNGYPGG